MRYMVHVTLKGLLPDESITPDLLPDVQNAEPVLLHPYNKLWHMCRMLSSRPVCMCTCTVHGLLTGSKVEGLVKRTE